MILVLPLFLLCLSIQAKADPIVIGDAIGHLKLNQGVMYSIKANSVQYTMTTTLADYKGFALVAGYSTAARAVAGLDFDLLNLKGIDIPLLKYVDVHLGYLASWDNIGGRNIIDHGPVATFVSLTF